MSILIDDSREILLQIAHGAAQARYMKDVLLGVLSISQPIGLMFGQVPQHMVTQTQCIGRTSVNHPCNQRSRIAQVRSSTNDQPLKFSNDRLTFLEDPRVLPFAIFYNLRKRMILSTLNLTSL